MIGSTGRIHLSAKGLMRLLVTPLLAAATLHGQNTPAGLRDIAERAYIYAYPLVLLEATRGAQSVNQFTHVPQFPRPDIRQIVRPNADTLYSTAWLDLAKEPILIHVPDSGGRFYLLQFMDAWTETFADPGKRTTGTTEAWFAVVGPNWKGTLPEHVTRLDAPTNIGWLLGRTQTNGASDYDNVHAFQRGMRMMPLSAYPNGELKLGSALAFGKSEGATPPDRVKALEPGAFFAAFAQAMKANPPHAADSAMVLDLAQIGIVPGEDFDYAIYLNSSADGAGQPLSGSMRYRMHFDKAVLPPVRAFWSITAYDKDGYFIANPIHRYAIGDRDPLKFNPDGSLDIYFQSQNPGPEKESNWLPSGDGSFNLTIRLYWPDEAILNGTWHPPALERLP